MRGAGGRARDGDGQEGSCSQGELARRRVSPADATLFALARAARKGSHQTPLRASVSSRDRRHVIPDRGLEGKWRAHRGQGWRGESRRARVAPSGATARLDASREQRGLQRDERRDRMSADRSVQFLASEVNLASRGTHHRRLAARVLAHAARRPWGLVRRDLGPLERVVLGRPGGGGRRRLLGLPLGQVGLGGARGGGL